MKGDRQFLPKKYIGTFSAVIFMKTQLESNFIRQTVRGRRISFMNVASVYYGLNNGNKPEWMDMACAPPSELKAMLTKGKKDEWILLP